MKVERGMKLEEEMDENRWKWIVNQINNLDGRRLRISVLCSPNRNGLLAILGK